MKRVYMKHLLIDETDAERAGEICDLLDRICVCDDNERHILQSQVNAKTYRLAAHIHNIWRHHDEHK